MNAGVCAYMGKKEIIINNIDIYLEGSVVLIRMDGDSACKDHRRKKLKWNEHIRAYISRYMYVSTNSRQHGD